MPKLADVKKVLKSVKSLDRINLLQRQAIAAEIIARRNGLTSQAVFNWGVTHDVDLEQLDLQQRGVRGSGFVAAVVNGAPYFA